MESIKNFAELVNTNPAVVGAVSFLITVLVACGITIGAVSYALNVRLKSLGSALKERRIV